MIRNTLLTVFVTKTDKRVEQILIDELSRAKKNFSFLTEESGKIEKNDKDKVWIIDPIDGTTNFLHGIPHFAISIALKIDMDGGRGSLLTSECHTSVPKLQHW